MPEQAPQPEQPTYPLTNVGLLPDGSGVQILTMFTPTIGIVQNIPEQFMNQLCTQWVENRRQLKKHHELVADILATKAR